MQSKVNLIIADDHPVFRTGLQKILKSNPQISSITTASNGNEVVSILENKFHEVVLMDIKMKPVCGIETTSILSKRFPQTRVIALSMNDDECSVTNMLKNGAYGYLVKSSDKEEILTAIREVSSGNKYFSREINYLLAKKVAEPTPVNEELKELKNDRIRDVLYLMCHELSNLEIADLICLSSRTVEYYRKRISELTNSRNYIGVIKYAFNSGIMDDPELTNKWDKKLLKYKN
jgi:DNA-binding NarL/FixJ family response regulator